MKVSLDDETEEPGCLHIRAVGDDGDVLIDGVFAESVLDDVLDFLDETLGVQPFEGVSL